MAKSKVTAVNALHNPGDPQGTLKDCRAVLRFVQQYSLHDGVTEEAEEGRYLVLACVIDALAILDEEVDAMERPVREEKLRARRDALEVVGA